MSLESTLRTVIGNLRSNRLEREEDVKLAVILPIPQALDWNNADPGSFKPEYAAGSGRVDYALLHHGRPQVFIEAKRRGALDVRAEEQLFRYASNNGVPLLVLTDGYSWDFYLSMADGLPEARRFYRLELCHEDRLPEYAAVFETYFRERCVASGEARRNAERCLESNRERTRAREAIPEAWNALLNEPDELLCDLLAGKVRDGSGGKPDPDDVREFLKNLSPALTRLAATHRPPIRQQDLANKERSPEPISDSSIAEPLSVAEGGHATIGDSSSQLLKNRSHSEGELQKVIYELMHVVLETHAELLDKGTILYLENEKNPMGTKLGYPLLWKTSEGRLFSGQPRYKKDVYAGQWYVCTEWNRMHHRHNAKKLAEWVKSLIAGADNSKARECLASMVNRLSACAEQSEP